MTRFWRRIGGWAGIFALVFAQLAMSAYACPKDAAAAAPAQSHAAMPCEDMARADTPLCRKHCSGADTAQVAAPVFLPAFAPSFLAMVEIPAIARETAFRRDPTLLHATSPPPTIRNCCFRI